MECRFAHTENASQCAIEHPPLWTGTFIPSISWQEYLFRCLVKEVLASAQRQEFYSPGGDVTSKKYISVATEPE